MGRHLSSYRDMVKTSESLEGHLERDQVSESMRVTRIPVPTRYTGSRNEDFVEVAYSNPIDAAVALLLDRKVHRTENDLLWRFEGHDEDNKRRYTPNLNSGDWWKRTEEKLCRDSDGRLIPNLHLLAFIIFIDDTQVVNRGTRSATPVILALGNSIEEVRNKKVGFCDF